MSVQFVNVDYDVNHGVNADDAVDDDDVEGDDVDVAAAVEYV